MAIFGLGRRRATKTSAGLSSDPEITGLVDALLAELTPSPYGWGPDAQTVRATAAWRAIASVPETTRASVAVEAFARAGHEPTPSGSQHGALVVLGQEILRSTLPLTAGDRVAMLRALVAHARHHSFGDSPRLDVSWDHTRSVLRALERGGEVERLSDEEALLLEVRSALMASEIAESRRTVARVDALLGAVPGEDGAVFSAPDWCAAAMEDRLSELPAETSSAGAAALRLATTVSSSKPSRRFLDQAAELARKYDEDVLGQAVGAVLRAGALPVTADRGSVDPVTGDAIRGLCWIASTLAPTPKLAASVGAWATNGWIKIPGVGARCRKGANGALWALARLGEPGAAELGRARSAVRQPQAVREVDAAIDAAAVELGIAREEFEERVVPTYGLQVGGHREVTLGDFTGTLRVEHGKAVVSIVGPDGRTRKTVPATVRHDHKAELAELRALAKDVSAMLRAQKLRVERLLMEDRSWEPSTWRDRYLDHPVVSVIARPLVWQEVGRDLRRVFIASDGQPRDITGAPVALGTDSSIELWHPATAPTAEVAAWRVRIEETGVVQPFKQAHREVYLLTDAERTTTVYSNRFAGHILRQHQFAALARARGWGYALQGAWDQPDERATLRLPQHGLVAEFWVDRPWDAEGDWNDSGVFGHVLTDQVRFTTLHGGEVQLDTVPPRVLTEVLRDVDLFVGVSSIGNDPSWQDSGGARRSWDGYWSSYSFGELGAAAEIRRDLLLRLLPKLAIRDVATLDDTFLVVKGSLRTYKIHLGSGNILMDPNDQYLCIVPARGDDERNDVMLPFEGDRMLSIVLSKAMLLADDLSIKDRTITSQIGRA